jgi:uncharacterized hydrophobic protein (TIGR00271 family)
LSSGGHPRRPPIRLEDWAKLIQQDSEEFARVSLDQIERIKIVHDRFLEGCTLSFNYNTLILVASVIAALGLASNSVATIIASMLVSPIMGPVVGIAYGATIRDWAMVRTSVRNECGSLVFCILMGAIIGAITGTTSLANSWPTPEMEGRGSVSNFLVGLPIAFFSGLGVAVSLLDEQFSSLVGVAISASLLPPAVNAGILWVAYAFYKNHHLGGDGDGDGGQLDYTASDFRTGGIMSLCLTLANIFLVSLASMIMFRLKEVLPIKKKVFWTDLGVARKIFQRKAFVQPSVNVSFTPSRAEALYRQASVMALHIPDETFLESPDSPMSS